MLNPLAFVLTLKSRACLSQISSPGLAPRRAGALKSFLNYPWTLGEPGKVPRGFQPIHSAGKLINHGNGAAAASVAPSFPLPLPGEPDGTPPGEEGPGSRAFGEGLGEIARVRHLHTMLLAVGALGVGVGRCILRALDFPLELLFENGEEGPHTTTFFNLEAGRLL